MLEAILETLKIMGWLGIILGILVTVNITTSTIHNIWSSKELFSWKKMLKGIGKSLVFYLSAVAISVACTMLPYVNEMITASFGVMLVSNETLEVLSSVGILGIVMSTIVIQAKKAITGISTLSNVSTSDEEVTWKVEEE
jgi:phage-related holin